MTVLSITEKRVLTGRLVFGYMLLLLLFRFFMKATPSQMLQPVLVHLGFDFTYWVYQLLHIPAIVLYNKAGSMVFDSLLLLTGFLCFLYPFRSGFALAFFSLFLIYVITFNTYAVAHSHQLALMSLMPVPFLCSSDKNWQLLWKGMRYYVCYVYVIAFVWKLTIGKSLLFWNQGLNVTKYNLVEYIYHFPETYLSAVYQWFIAHPYLLNGGFIFFCCLEGALLIGFFTRKWDRLLILIVIMIHFSSYLFSDVFFAEFLIGIIVFLKDGDLKKLHSIFRKGNVHARTPNVF